MSSAEQKPIVPYSEFEQLREARSIIRQEAEALEQLAGRLDHRFSQAVTQLLNCAGSVVVTGVGKAGLIGQKLVATLASTGTPSHFMHPVEAVHGDLGCVRSQDVVLALSNSGETAEVVRLLPMLKRDGIPIVAITSTAENTLGRGADVALVTGRVLEAGAHGLAPSTSTSVMLALGDALALVTSHMRGFSRDDFARLHPGGSLGDQLKRVHEVMRPLSSIRVAAETETIREILTRFRGLERRAGAVILTDADGCVSGLFTDSDLSRLIEKRLDTDLDCPIANSMTRSPLVVTGGEMLTDAVAMLSDRKFSELPVVDEYNRPIGLVDITDVIGLQTETKSQDKADRDLRICDDPATRSPGQLRGSA